MTNIYRTVMLAASLLVCAPPALRAQTADPSGHWKGSLEIPGRTLTFEVDLAKTSSGSLIGAASGDDVRNIPLAKVAVDGRAVTFYARSDQPYNGVLAADGRSMSGTIILSGYTLPLEFTRTGEATIEPPPTSAPIGKELEGTWNGTINADNGPLRIVVLLANQPGGRATARMVSVDEGGFTAPLVITQNGSDVKLDSRGVGSYTGTLKADGTELTGTWNQSGISLPLSLRRAGGSTNGDSDR